MIWKIKRHFLEKGYRAYFRHRNSSKSGDFWEVPPRDGSLDSDSGSLDASLGLVRPRKYRIIRPVFRSNKKRHLNGKSQAQQIAVNTEIESIRSLIKMEEKKTNLDQSTIVVKKRSSRIQKKFLKTLMTKGSATSKRAKKVIRYRLRANPLHSSLVSKPPLNHSVRYTALGSLSRTKMEKNQHKRYKDFEENRLVTKKRYKASVHIQAAFTKVW